MKIMSDEMLVAAYRNALTQAGNKTEIDVLKSELSKRGISPKISK